MRKLGIQLWSYTSDEQEISFLDRIKLAKEQGFDTIEYAGNYEQIETEEMKKILEETGVELLSAHVPYQALEKHLPYLASLGVKYIIAPSAPYNSHEEAMIIANRLNEFGELCRPYGIKTGFHNHANDFYIENGKPIVDTIYDNTNPETVIIQLDVGHAVGGGADPIEYLKRYAGRVESVHIKENKGVLELEQPKSYYDKTPNNRFTIDENGKKVPTKEWLEEKKKHDAVAVKMGESQIDWKEVIETAEELFPNVDFIIEREVSYNEPKDRLVCIKEDFDYIKKLM